MHSKMLRYNKDIFYLYARITREKVSKEKCPMKTERVLFGRNQKKKKRLMVWYLMTEVLHCCWK